jgi:hypothetical protein
VRDDVDGESLSHQAISTSTVTDIVAGADLQVTVDRSCVPRMHRTSSMARRRR